MIGKLGVTIMADAIYKIPKIIPDNLELSKQDYFCEKFFEYEGITRDDYERISDSLQLKIAEKLEEDALKLYVGSRDFNNDEQKAKKVAQAFRNSFVFSKKRRQSNIVENNAPCHSSILSLKNERTNNFESATFIYFEAPIEQVWDNPIRRLDIFHESFETATKNSWYISKDGEEYLFAKAGLQFIKKHLEKGLVYEHGVGLSEGYSMFHQIALAREVLPEVNLNDFLGNEPYFHSFLHVFRLMKNDNKKFKEFEDLLWCDEFEEFFTKMNSIYLTDKGIISQEKSVLLLLDALHKSRGQDEEALKIFRSISGMKQNL